MSTSTHWTNSSHTLSPVLFLTDQHNASQNLIMEFCLQILSIVSLKYIFHIIYSKSAHAQCDIFVCKII